MKEKKSTSERKPGFAILAEARQESPLAGQSGFLCEDGELLIFQAKEDAELRIKDIRGLCMNNAPAADYRCAEQPDSSASGKRMDLERLRALDTVPVFNPENFEIRNRVYGNSGGWCMVATMEVYLPDLNKTVWVNCNNECLDITSADYVWNGDGSDSSERYTDVTLFSLDYHKNHPDIAGAWLPMILKTLEYIIQQETEFSLECDFFSLPIEWLPESIRELAEPEYLAWLSDKHQKINIGKSNRIIIDEVYQRDSPSQAGAGGMEMR